MWPYIGWIGTNFLFHHLLRCLSDNVNGEGAYEEVQMWRIDAWGCRNSPTEWALKCSGVRSQDGRSDLVFGGQSHLDVLVSQALPVTSDSVLKYGDTPARCSLLVCDFFIHHGIKTLPRQKRSSDPEPIEYLRDHLERTKDDNSIRFIKWIPP